MTFYRRFFLLPILCAALQLVAAPLLQAAQNPPVTIRLPAAALHQTLVDMLPLPLEQNSKQFSGTITVDSISRLVINNNMISLQGQVSGSNMKLTTNIGGQNIKLNLGKLVLPVDCDIALRFDRQKKTLFLTPRFKNPTHASSNSAKTLLPLLNGLSNKEYPVTMDKITPFTARIGTKTIAVRMQPVDIKAADNALILQFKPIVSQIH